MNLSKRASEVEIMDDLDCSGPVVDQTLRELDIINQWLGGNAVTLNPVKSLFPKINSSSQPTILVDLGCGSGDMLRRIARWARQENIGMTGIGIDANPNIIAYARQASSSFKELDFQTLNIFSTEFQSMTFDVVLATLFTHHFTHEELVLILTRLKKQTRKFIIINDIHRHPLAYYSIRWLTTFFSRSDMVKFDAPLSVRRAFLKKEWEAILKEAGVENYQLRWRWAFRWQLIIHLSE
jgi:2-polyprenyl-3-methyl-5-hydroxy-6-metoxy-1,4-benzoquinol methylase